ncbi:5-oxoprolinase subunit B family protein [Amycolatopsis azurea]|uniref:Allophanate hydrolase n=1 Tax=Amycolatopsis azurea DSM 43854 TaxID=1238180 RepID=M2QTX7_9PSEU|nr:carboxyltransferase domain-containing protein [Amycolatopsis azurea]EMD29457.1 Allophanate hydrolase 2 subunit 1 [Amycolatopsis azurea DSM 43854]OOC02763.1 allophanate hydrolase [Amycolatopsis azurea DSM 43854]
MSGYEFFADGARVSFGGDEFVFVEVCEGMDLAQALRIQAITGELARRELPGVLDVAPANASYLVRADPDVLHPRELVRALARLHDRFGEAGSVALDTEIVEIPVWYADPETERTCLKFRDRHQSPTETDIAYTARINGLASVADLVAAHTSAPFIVTFPCFKPGNTECVQLVPRERQIQAPKYLRPRTETPARAVAHGGAFTVVYPTAGVGGYQLLGRSPVPVADLTQQTPGFETSKVLATISTLLRFRSVPGEEYEQLRTDSREGRYRYRRAPVRFALAEFLADPAGYPRTLEAALSC